jgi:hypothetical protein
LKNTVPGICWRKFYHRYPVREYLPCCFIPLAVGCLARDGEVGAFSNDQWPGLAIGLFTTEQASQTNASNNTRTDLFVIILFRG